MEKEIRTIDIVECELRATRRGRTIEGTSIVFNKLSEDLGGFKEVVRPEAIDGVLEKQDILALMNHDESRGVLARYTNGQGSMEVRKENNGVRFSFESPDTPLGDEALSGVRRGDIRGTSFSFRVADGGDKWEKQSDNTYLRTITKFEKIGDFSLVYRPAYMDTTVAVRSLVDVRTKEETAEANQKIADLEEELRKSKLPPLDSTEVAKPKDLTEYFNELERKIKK